MSFRFFFRMAGALCLLAAVSCSSGGGGPTAPKVDLSDQVIVAFGDSITRGVGDSAYPSRAAGYPFRLEQLLGSRFPNAIVLNRGVEGEETTVGVRRIRSVIRSDNPDYILILEGVNNIKAGTTSEAREVASDIEQMVQTAKSSGAIPLVGSLLPTTGPRGFKNDAIGLANTLIAELADREEITFVDLHGLFYSSDDYTAWLTDDGLHPNSAGYNVMAQGWYDGLLGNF